MGCVQAKKVPAKRVPPSCQPRQGHGSFKRQNGYATSGGGRRLLHQKQTAAAAAAAAAAKLATKSEVDDAKNIVGVVNGVSDGGKLAERKLISREGESNGIVGNASRRITAKKIAAEELVDGWPKWLVDNIPGDVLVALVPKSADSYDKLAKVGQGTYSNVYKARDRETGKIVALKKVRFDTSEPESVKFMAREIVILQKLDHPNVIKLEGLATSRMQYSLYLVFDFMQSDLVRLVSRFGRLTEPQVKCYMQQLLSGLHHCHERGILHRDIKGSNLLIDKNGILKIADFGLANFFQPRQKCPLTSRVVTLWYRAPELLLGATDYGVGIDLWSAGCLLAEMFVGKPIMPGRTEVEQLHRIFKLCGSPADDYWKRIKPPTTFRPPQQYKPSFQENLTSLPSSSFGLLTTLLALEPANRGTAASALQNEFFSSSPLACDLSGLPAVNKEEDEPIPINDRKKKKTNKKQRSQKINGSQGRRNSISVQAKEDSGSCKEELWMAKNAEGSMQSQAMGNSSISCSASSVKPFTSSRTTTTSSSDNNQSAAPSPSSYLRSLHHHSQSAKTEAHPNALKNIKNFPILLASLAESGKHIKFPATASAPSRRSVSTVEFQTIDLDKISKLFGVDDA